MYQVIFYFNQKRKQPIRLTMDLIISVGNLSVGGTGKTPFTIYLTKLINSIYTNSEVTILSRGYGSKLSNSGAVVELHSSADEVGDEPFLIKQELREAEVIIGSNRVLSFHRFSRHANESPDSKILTNKKDYKSILILDDGFQHLAIARDIDIVLVDGRKPIENGLTLPIGRLRETEKSLVRANVLIFTRCRFANGRIYYDSNWEKRILRKFPHLSIFHAQESKLGYYNKKVWMDLRKLENEYKYGHKFLEGKRVFAFCGLASPSSFFKSIQDENPGELECKQYKDHYNFPESELENLFQKLEHYDILICTEKDFVKIYSRIKPEYENKIFFLKIESSILELEQWTSFWKNVLDSKIVK